METLGRLLSITFTEPHLALLLRIAEESLTGSVNSIAPYTKFVYNDLKKYELNSRIADILSNKNVEKALNLATSDISVVKLITLPPLFSRYITIYGFPEFGVGFDPLRISFIQSLDS